MRSIAFVVGAALAAMSFASLPCLSAHAQGSGQNRSGQAAQAAQACPAGTHWVNAGYARHGKWRDAYCAPDSSRR